MAVRNVPNIVTPYLIDATDNSKRALILNSGATTGTTLTLANQQTTSQTLNFPNVTSGDTIVTINTIQTFSNKNLNAANCYIVDSSDSTKHIAFSAAGNTTGITLTIATQQTTSQTINFPNITGSDTLVTLGLSQTFTNKLITNNSCYFVDGTDVTKKVTFQSSAATTSTILTLVNNQTTSQSLSIPNVSASDSFATINATQTLTNKTLTGTTNTIRATQLATTGSDVVVSGAAPGASGQALMLTSPTTATWQSIYGTLPSVNMYVYVELGGSDTTGNGTISFPYASITQAIASITTASPTNRYAIIVGPGTYTANLSLKADVFIVGTGVQTTRITGNIDINDTSWNSTSNDDRSGIIGVNISGTATINFTTNTSSAGKFYIYSSAINGLLSMTAYNAVNQIFCNNTLLYASFSQTGCQHLFFGSVDLAGGATVSSSTYCATILYSYNSTFTGNLTGTYTSSNNVTIDLYNTGVVGTLTLTGASLTCNATAEAISLSPVVSGGATLNRLSDVVSLIATQTLTNKTLTSPVISSIINTGTLTLPTSTDTLMGRATTDTLTNKSLVNASCLHVDGTDNTKKIGFSTSSNTTGITLTVSSAQTTNQTLNIPNITTSDTIVTLALAQTLTNKTLTSPVISSITNGAATLTLPTSTDTLMGRATTDTMTNKSFVNASCLYVDATDNTKKIGFSTSSNTTGITLTIASQQTTSQTLSIPNVASGDTIVTLNTTQTLANKTLTTPNIGAATGTSLTLSGLTASQAVVTNGSSALTSMSYTPNATASTISQRDTNANIAYNNVTQGFTPITAAGGTTTLTVASSDQIYITGSTTHTVVLPAVTTIPQGTDYIIYNQSTGNITIQSSGLNTITTLPNNCSCVFTSIATTGTTAAVWNYSYSHTAYSLLTTTGAVNVGSAAPGTAGQALVLTSPTAATWQSVVTNLTGVITSAGNTTSWVTPTGTGVVVLNTSPTLVTPNIGAATGTSLSVTGQLTSTIATGTSPLIVTSTTQVSNLTATNSANINTTSTSTNASYYPLFVASSSSGYQTSCLNSNFSYNPSTTTLSTSLLAIGSTTTTTQLYIAGNITGNPATIGQFSTNSVTITDSNTAASGTAASMFAINFGQPTLTSTNTVVTTTLAATVNIMGAPAKGTNDTATTTAGLNIAAGAVGAQTTSYGALINAQTGGTTNYSIGLVGGDVYIPAVTGAVRQLIFGNIGGGTYPSVGGACRLQSNLGDFLWQGAGGMALQMGAYHEVILAGGRGTGSTMAFSSGNTSTYNTRIINSSSAQIGITIEGLSGQSVDLERWIVNGSTLSVMNSQGYLGLGNSSPGYQLDVTGDVHISGNIYDSTNSNGSASQVLTSTGSAIQWANPTTNIILGDSNIENTADANTGLMLLTQYSLTQSGTIQSMSYYVASYTGGQSYLGLYSDNNGNPGTLQATTAIITPSVGWNTVSVTTPVLLSPGVYWTALLSSSTGITIRRSPTGYIARTSSQTFGALPTTYSTSGQGIWSYSWSVYATITSVGANTMVPFCIEDNAVTTYTTGTAYQSGTTITGHSTTFPSVMAANGPSGIIVWKYYSTGTASQSGTTITGVGTTWTSTMANAAGNVYITFANGWSSVITSFTSTTSLTSSSSATVSSQSYAIYVTANVQGYSSATSLTPCYPSQTISSSPGLAYTLYYTSTFSTTSTTYTNVTGVTVTSGLAGNYKATFSASINMNSTSAYGYIGIAVNGVIASNSTRLVCTAGYYLSCSTNCKLLSVPAGAVITAVVCVNSGYTCYVISPTLDIISIL